MVIFYFQNGKKKKKRQVSVLSRTSFSDSEGNPFTFIQIAAEQLPPSQIKWDIFWLEIKVSIELVSMTTGACGVYVTDFFI